MLEGIGHLKHAVTPHFDGHSAKPHAGKPSVGRIFVEVVIRDLRGLAIGRREDHFAHQRFGDPPVGSKSMGEIVQQTRV